MAGHSTFWSINEAPLSGLQVTAGRGLIGLAARVEKRVNQEKQTSRKNKKHLGSCREARLSQDAHLAG